MAFDHEDRHRDRRSLNRGFGDAMSQAVDLVVTPLVIGAFGWFLDQRLGWSPILTVTFAALGIVGTFVKLWLGYDARMKTEEQARRDRLDAKRAAA